MLIITDLNAEFAKLKMLGGRTPQTTAAEREENRTLARLMPYRDGTIFITKFAGSGEWERHPKGDEIVQIIDGTTTLHVASDGHSEAFTLRRRGTRCHSPGSMASVRVGRRCGFDDCDSPALGLHHRG